jgi:Skp family chaperone for outer membrane proteins
MTFKTFAVAAGAAAAALSAAGAAHAQAAQPAAPAATTAPAITHGNPVPGLCVLTPPALIASSAVGKQVQTRLQQLGQQAQAEVQSEQTAIQNEAKTLESQRATLDQTTFNQRYALLQVREDALNRKVQLRREELAATQQKQFQRVLQEAQPFIRQAYQAKNCSILLNAEAVAFGLGNPASDITGQVVTGLNSRITQLTFDRERLDTAPAAGQAGAAPRPAAPATPAPTQPQRR